MIYLDSEKKEQLKLLELLQFKELKIYEKYLLLLEEKFNPTVVERYDESSLAEMLAQKKEMMVNIDETERDLSSLRQGIAAWIDELSSTLYSETAVRVENIKRIDLQIIDIINNISRIEQNITKEIKLQLEKIQVSLQDVEARKKIAKGYSQQSNKVPKEGSAFDLLS
jgi:hypothetical protein